MLLWRSMLSIVFENHGANAHHLYKRRYKQFIICDNSTHNKKTVLWASVGNLSTLCNCIPGIILTCSHSLVENKFVLQSKKTPASPFCEIMNECKMSFSESASLCRHITNNTCVSLEIEFYVLFVFVFVFADKIAFVSIPIIPRDTKKKKIQQRIPPSCSCSGLHRVNTSDDFGKFCTVKQEHAKNIFQCLHHGRRSPLVDRRWRAPLWLAGELSISAVYIKRCEVEFPRLQHIHGLLP